MQVPEKLLTYLANECGCPKDAGMEDDSTCGQDPELDTSHDCVGCWKRAIEKEANK